MQRKRDGLVSIGEVFDGLDGPVKAIRDASPQALPLYPLRSGIAVKCDPEGMISCQLLKLDGPF